VGDFLAYRLGLMVGDQFKVFSPRNVDEILDAFETAESEGETDVKREAFEQRLAGLAEEGMLVREAVLALYEELDQDPEFAKGFELFKASIDELQMEQPLKVTGIFRSPKFPVVYVPLQTAQELYALGDSVHGINVYTRDAFRITEYKKQLLDEGIIPPYWQAPTWTEKYSDLFQIIKNERAMMFFVLFFITIVAAFCIMNTMITVTMQKRKEIGMMRALGARVSQVVNLFLYKGMVVAGFGVTSGLAAGLIVLYFRNGIRTALSKVGFDIFPAEHFQLIEIPMRLDPFNLLSICLVAFVLCSVAAIPPAWMVARVDPARALRNQ
jgi:lipoprotein-releasing system permease protein